MTGRMRDAEGLESLTERPRCSWRGNIKVDLQEIKFGVVVCSNLSQDGAQ
jgi:hypothetical protein